MLDRDLEAGELWERLWERLQAFMSDLEELAGAEDARERLTYPAVAQFVYEECRAVASYYRQWLELRFQHRVRAGAKRAVVEVVDVGRKRPDTGIVHDRHPQVDICAKCGVSYTKVNP